jgi:hypothetical protein
MTNVVITLHFHHSEGIERVDWFRANQIYKSLSQSLRLDVFHDHDATAQRQVTRGGYTPM